MMDGYYESGPPQLTPTTDNEGKIVWARKGNDCWFSWRCVLCNETVPARKYHDCDMPYWDQAVEYAQKHWRITKIPGDYEPFGGG
jgi:hypothetical protein